MILVQPISSTILLKDRANTLNGGVWREAKHPCRAHAQPADHCAQSFIIGKGFMVSGAGKSMALVHFKSSTIRLEERNRTRNCVSTERSRSLSISPVTATGSSLSCTLHGK